MREEGMKERREGPICVALISPLMQTELSVRRQR